jgi:hypothetical protein
VNSTIKGTFEFVWYDYIVDSLIIFGVLYIPFLVIFFPYYWVFTNPYRLQLLFSPKVSKILFASLFILSGFPILLNYNDLNLVELQDIVKLSWTIFAISVTFALVTFFLVSSQLSEDKVSNFEEDKIYHNSIVFLNLVTFTLLSINVFFLSWSTLSVFVTSRENEIVNQVFVKIGLWLSLSVVVNSTYDFISLIKKKRNELMFSEAELLTESEELKKQSIKFGELKGIVKSTTSRSKLILKKKKKLERTVDKLKLLADKLEGLDLKSDMSKFSYFEKKRLFKDIKMFGKLISIMHSLEDEIKSIEHNLDTMQSKISNPTNN